MNLIVLQESQYQTLLNKIDSLYELLAEKAAKQKDDDLLSTTEAAKRLKVCSKTIINLIEAGKLKAVKLNKGEGKRGHFKIPTSEVDKFIKINRLGY